MNDAIVFRNKLVLVMGLQRSGTTALLYALGQDPSLQVENEQPQSPLWDAYLLRPEPEIRPLLWSIKRRIIMKPVLEIERRSIDEVLAEFQEYDPLVVWIYRDPVNVWSSARKEFSLKDREQDKWIYKWVEGNESALRSLEGPRGDRIVFVRYEDLIERREVFEDLCRFLRIEPRNNLFWREDLKKGRKSIAPEIQSWIEGVTAPTLARLHEHRIVPMKQSSALEMDKAVLSTGGAWQLQVHDACQANLVDFRSDKAAARVQFEAVDATKPHGVQLIWGNLSFDVGRRYTVSLWARADRPRVATVQVSQNHDPWQSIGPCHEIHLDERWRPVAFDFEPTQDDSNARVLLDLAQSDAAVEASPVVVGSPLYRLFELYSHDASIATLTPAPAEKDGVRIEFSSLDQHKPESVQLTMGRFTLETDKMYSVSLRARSDANRDIAVVVGQDCDPWATAGIYQKLALTPQWATHLYTFRITQSGPGRLYFDLGNDDVAVEIADVALCRAESHVNDLFERNGAQCLIQFPVGQPGVLRAMIATGDKKEPQDVQIFIAERPIQVGKRYFATFEGRADRPRDIGFGCVNGKTEWTSVGLYYRVGVGTHWKPYYYEFVAEEDADVVRVLFDLGESATPIEIRNVRFEEGMDDINAEDVARLEYAVEALRDALAADTTRG